MASTWHEREVVALIAKYGKWVRQTTHGNLYEFRNLATGACETVLVGGAGSSAHGQGSDEKKWRAALRDAKRAVRHAFGITFKEEDEDVANETRPPAPSAPAKTTTRSDGAGPLAGLVVQTKEKKIVVSEVTKTVELAPHHLHALLRGCGYEVPDDAKVTFTAQGYVRVAWTKTVESEEG